MADAICSTDLFNFMYKILSYLLSDILFIEWHKELKRILIILGEV